MATISNKSSFQLVSRDGVVTDLTPYITQFAVMEETIDISSMSTPIRETIPGLTSIAIQSHIQSAREKKTKCAHCGQWGAPKTACKFCGAPVD